MRWLSIEPGSLAYRADFAVYGLLLLALAATLLAGPPEPRLMGWALLGLLGWTLLEYLLHRFVLHGLAPFSRWHAEHHRRPRALIAAPTVLSLSLFAVLLLPAAWWLGARPTAAFGFGLIGGYFGYGLIHHAIHQPSREGRLSAGQGWMRQRRLWHALHHGGPVAGSTAGRPAHYGVSSAFWDRVFGTDGRGSS